jgi:hypothetical protein
VQITTPAANAEFTNADDVGVTVTASDADGGIASGKRCTGRKIEIFGII